MKRIPSISPASPILANNVPHNTNKNRNIFIHITLLTQNKENKKYINYT
ncbi:hypothetical protein BACSTE_03216 [Bacteroides stercoris ATCC 43183]|uniref:Uncharacterized protein n=1 Tax=Bacteroides stercoris ATCC 43183 TaxID=449673 RepID=B0NUN1_BACSE|nr:hypothetical protein BACSTE_03216 [Bacteroides stercoris ATCC 43183]